MELEEDLVQDGVMVWRKVLNAKVMTYDLPAARLRDECDIEKSYGITER